MGLINANTAFLPSSGYEIYTVYRLIPYKKRLITQAFLLLVKIDGNISASLNLKSVDIELCRRLPVGYIGQRFIGAPEEIVFADLADNIAAAE